MTVDELINGLYDVEECVDADSPDVEVRAPGGRRMWVSGVAGDGTATILLCDDPGEAVGIDELTDGLDRRDPDEDVEAADDDARYEICDLYPDERGTIWSERTIAVLDCRAVR